MDSPRLHRSCLAALGLLGVLLGATACASAEDLFVSGRLRDTCNESWPVCTTVAGCMVGDTSYLEGKFPGTRRFIVKTDGQREISVVLFFKNEGAIGTETRIVWNEAGCGASSIEVIDGRSLFKEAAIDGTLKRSKNVFTEGDHLIEITSDATVDYLLRIETKPASAP